MSGGYDGRAVLVTGAQGFIGSWLAEALLEDGARVVVPQRESSGNGGSRRGTLHDHCELVRLDLLDPASAVRAINEFDVGVVFHLAAQTIVETANESPLATYEANVRGTYNLLEAARMVGDGESPRVVVASSYHAYGRHATQPLSEDLALQPSYPYDVSKACGDMLARCYAATYGTPVAVTRLANVYGGGDLNFSRIVPDTARALARGDRPVVRSDGTPERDYLYVADAVSAYLAVADSLAEPRLRGRAWNVGGDAPVAVIDVVRRLIRASGRELEPEVLGDARARDEIDRQYLDSSAIREELGWAPVWGLDRGLTATYAWYEEQLS